MGVSRARSVWTWAGIAVVAVSAAVMSFATLWRLAERADVPRELAWLLPVAIDATIVVATSVWLTGQPGHHRVTRYARGLALSALVLSVAGNAAEHGMSAYEIVAPWWVLVAVSAVPPAALGATVHLASLLTAIPAAASATPEKRSHTAPPSAPATTGRATKISDTRSAPTGATAPQPTTATALPQRPTKRGIAGKGEVTEAMREVFDRYVAEGRADQLTGRVLADVVGAAPSLGRRRLAEWRSELDNNDEEAPAA
ncbi:MAG: DUF2637 domain-containing protein [Thermocrispum sp.]